MREARSRCNIGKRRSAQIRARRENPTHNTAVEVPILGELHRGLNLRTGDYPSLSVGRPALTQSCLPPGYSLTFVYPMVTSSRATLSEACQLKLVQ